MTIQDDVNNLVTDVQDETTVVDSVEKLLTNLTSMITNLKGQIVDPATQKALQDAVSALQANKARIVAAVTANTPAS